MGRRPHFENAQFFDAALGLLVAGGPAAVTVAGIAGALGAPVGSVYHRFASRDVILAGLWLRTAEAFQRGFLDVLVKGDAVDAALYTARWARAHPEESRLLLLHRQEELTSGPWPEEMRSRSEALAIDLRAGLRRFAKRRFGKAGREELDRVVFALADVPLAAVQRHLQAGERSPESVDALVRETCQTVLRRNHEDPERP